MMRRANALLTCSLAPHCFRSYCHLLRPLPPSFASLPCLSRSFSASNPSLSSTSSLIKQAHDAKHALITRLRAKREPADWTHEHVYLTGDAYALPSHRADS